MALCCFGILSAASLDFLDRQLILQAVNLGTAGQYEKAFAALDSLKMRRPNSPAPFLFEASLFQSMMIDFQSDHWAEAFNNSVDQTLALCDSAAEETAEILFYRGAAAAYRGFFLARSGQYWSGIRTSMKAVDILERALQQDSTLADAYLAVGTYLYWRSRLTRLFSWLPFFPDRRKEGITLVERAAKHAAFSQWAAVSTLGWIFMEEKRYEDAASCAERGLASFPGSRFFLWLLAEALCRSGKTSEAAAVYETLLDSVRTAAFNNHYSEIVLHLKLAQCYRQLQPESALKHAREAVQLIPDDKVAARAAAKQKEAAALLRELEKEAAMRLSQKRRRSSS